MRLGAYPAILERGSKIASIYGDDRDFRASPPPLRDQHQLPRPPGAARPALRRPVAGRHPAGDGRICGPSLVHRRAVPPRAEVAPLRPAPAVRLVHRGGGGAVAAGVMARRHSRAWRRAALAAGVAADDDVGDAVRRQHWRESRWAFGRAGRIRCSPPPGAGTGGAIAHRYPRFARKPWRGARLPRPRCRCPHARRD